MGAFLAPVLGGQVFIGEQALDGGFFNSLRTAALPLTAHAILGVLVLAAFGIQVGIRKVIPLPNPAITISLVSVICAFGMACAISSFKWLSWTQWLEWITYAFALLATVSIVGRDRGPRVVLWALVAGCAITSLIGIQEYASMRSTDPSWRIFAHWINPNALAGMLLIGVVLALGLAVSEEDRLHKLIAGFAAIAIGFAILLTQSKGGFLGVGVGLVSLAVLQFWFGARKQLLALLVPLLVVTLLAAALRSNSTTGAGLARVEAAGGTAEQSAGFRQLLWKGAVEMVKENPFGYGLGTFRYESARPGLTPQTQFAHQGWLQIAAETGVVGFAAWLALAVAWFATVLRGARRAPKDRSVRLGAVIAAVIACATHNMVDSDWQHFGIGFAFFLLLGIGTQLAADGSLPELLPRPARITALLLPSVIALALIHSGTVEILKATASAMLRTNYPKAGEILNTAKSLAPGDGEVYWLLSYTTPNEPKTTWANIELAAQRQPTTSNLRMVAMTRRIQGDKVGAQRALTEALQRDPNNLPTLAMLTRWASEDGDADGVRKWASRAIGVKSTSYYLVRALPQVIPTEIAECELVLAKHAGQDEADDLRLDALRIYAEYARITVPLIKAHWQAGAGAYAGELPTEATFKLAAAETVAKEMLLRYQREGRPTEELAELTKVLAPPDFGPLR